ncbi:GIN domain-containing protein [Sphingomonas sp. NCPPB 2930]|uniref:GIN domain-containing protein n=1 Tax=Sphingomonas sp. NCPPB 2930 TaxID=3162788 RepID=UPI0036DB8792
MRHLLPSALILAALIPVTGAGAADRRVDLSSFDSLRVEGAFVVALTTAPSPRAMLSGDAETLRRVDAHVAGHSLVVRMMPGDPAMRRPASQPVTLTLAAPPLSAITVIGGSRITAQALRGPGLSVSIAGPSDVRIDRVEGEQLAVSLMGSGRLAIGGGRVGKARLAGNGTVTIAAEGLEVGDLAVTLEGPGEVTARARYSATIANNGLGRVTVDGTPKCRILGGGGGTTRCGAR